MANFFRWLFGCNKAKTRDVHGNMLIGDNYGIVIQTTRTPPSPPVLPWRELEPAPDHAAARRSLDIFKMLSWRSRLAQTLVGRDADRERLLAWARDDASSLSLRLLTGPGGAGKSRLAAEVAQQLRGEGWISGLADMNGENEFPLGGAGVFVVIDYPEAHREAVRRLLHAAGRLDSLPCKIRFLLVSRCSQGWWAQDLINAGASEVCDTQDVQVGPLCAADTVALIRNVAERAAYWRGRAAPELDEGAITAWYARNPQLHGLPLFASAAAVHAVLERHPEFMLAGEQIISALVKRERKRFDLAGRNNRWRDSAAARLHALAATRNGLDAQAVQALAVVTPPLGLPEPGRMVDDLMSLGWWEGERLPAPQPDLLAAELLYQVLRERQDAAPHWLAATLPAAKVVEIPRLDRLAYDMARLHPDAAGAFAGWLRDAVEGNADLAEAWQVLLVTGGASFRLAPVGVAIGRLLLGTTTISDEDRAPILNSLSNRLSDAGDAGGALAAIKEAVEIRRGLAAENPARFAHGLAGSLNNLSNRLSFMGDLAEALATISEAVEILRVLEAENPGSFAPDLAMSLNNLSNRLAATGDMGGALAAIKEAVERYRKLAAKSPAFFAPDLAMSLNNLASRLSDAGDEEGALAAIREGLDIYRRLEVENPARFAPDLAGSLNNLCNCLFASGDLGRALVAIKQAVEIRRVIAAENPARFAPDLAGSLHNLCNCLSAAGDAAEGLAAIEEAVDISRSLVAGNVASFEPNMGKMLINLAVCRHGAGDTAGAMEAASESVAIFRRLGQNNSVFYREHLEKSQALLAKLTEASITAEST